MTTGWSEEQVRRIHDATELEIAARGRDGALRRWTPVWAVVSDGRVYVRTWYRRDTGWFGRAVASGRARVRVPGVETDVEVEDVGAGTPDLRSGIADAYRAKYGSGGQPSVERMVSAADTTLRLSPETAP